MQQLPGLGPDRLLYLGKLDREIKRKIVHDTDEATEDYIRAGLDKPSHVKSQKARK